MRAIYPVLHTEVTAGCHFIKSKVAGAQAKPKKAASARSTFPRSAAPRCPKTLPTFLSDNVLHLSAMICDCASRPFSADGATVTRNTCFGRTSLVRGRNVTDSIASYL